MKDVKQIDDGGAEAAMPKSHFGDSRLTDDDVEAIRKVAGQFGVSPQHAYYRAKSLRLLSYQVREDHEAYYAKMRKIMAHAVADGFSEGNEPYPQASETMKLRYDMAADAVLNEMIKLQKSSRE